MLTAELSEIWLFAFLTFGILIGKEAAADSGADAPNAPKVVLPKNQPSAAFRGISSTAPAFDVQASTPPFPPPSLPPQKPVKIIQGVFDPASGEQAFIDSTLQVAGDISVRIFDIRGRLVRELIRAPRQPGNYRDPWDGRNGGGETVASGIYFIRVTGGELNQTKRAVVVK